MAAQNNDDDVQFIQQNPIQMGDVVDLLGDDDFDEVFNVDDLSSPTSNSNNNTSIHLYINYSGMLSISHAKKHGSCDEGGENCPEPYASDSAIT